MNYFKGREFLIVFVLFVCTVASRLPFMHDVLYNADSVSFVLATLKYDIAIHQPHPPGYFLYVMAGKLLNPLTGDPNKSFVLLSVFSSGLAVAFLYLLAREMFDERVALWSSLLLASSPIFWHFGEVATTYAPEAFFSVLFAYICYKINNGERRLIWLSAVVLALAGGVRQSTAVFLFPLWIFSIRKAPIKRIIAAFALLTAFVLAWFVPMVHMTGGYVRYAEALDELVRFTVKPLSIAGGSFDPIGLLQTFLTLSYYAVGPALVFVAFIVFRQGLWKDLLSLKTLFIMVWISPMLLFFLFVSTLSKNPGYVLLVTPAVAIVSVWGLSGSIERLPASYRPKVISVILCVMVVFNCYAYFFKRGEFTLGFLNYQKTILSDFTKKVRGNFSPSDTVILSMEYIYFGPRHFIYYLPEYRVYTAVNVRDREGRRRNIFWGTGRKTYLSKTVEIPDGVKYFVSPHWDPVLIGRLSPSEFASIMKISSGRETLGFYGDIRLAPKLYDVPFTFGK